MVLASALQVPRNAMGRELVLCEVPREVDRVIEFTVGLKAQPQGSSNAYVRGGRAVVTSANKHLKPYRKLVNAEAWEAAYASGHAVDERGPVFGRHVPVKVTALFTFLRPPSAPKARKQHVVKPDADKLLRGLLDALTGVIWHDDAQVVEIYAQKRYGVTESVFVRTEVIAC